MKRNVTITVNRNMLGQIMESALARAESLDGDDIQDVKLVDFIHECVRHVDLAIINSGEPSILGTEEG